MSRKTLVLLMVTALTLSLALAVSSSFAEQDKGPVMTVLPRNISINAIPVTMLISQMKNYAPGKISAMVCAKPATPR